MEELPEVIQKFIYFAQRWITLESANAAVEHKFNDDDVFITTGPKAGTTWTETMVHLLRSNLDVSFDEIHEIIPWPEICKDVGVDLNSPQQWSPRLFKTHSSYDYVPHNVKHVVVVRNPKDCAVSFYHFHKNWVFDEKDLTQDDYIKYLVLPTGAQENPAMLCSFWHFITSWYPHRHDQNILWLHFEDIKANQKAVIKLIADFLDIGKDNEELQDSIIEYTSIETMRNNKTKFDAHFLKLRKNEFCGLKKTAGMEEGNEGLVRAGNTGDHQHLSDWIVEELNKKWKSICEAELGFKSYEEMREAINKELKRPF